MNVKKIFIIAAILLFLAAGTLMVYNFFIKNSTSENPETSESLPPQRDDNTATPTPTNQTGGQNLPDLKIRPISQDRAYSPTIGAEGKTVKYFNRANGHVFESAFDGSETKEISTVTLSNQVKAIWSPDTNKVIGIFSENEKMKKYFYDYANNQSSLLNESIGYLSWSPDSKKIAYQFSSSENEENTISTANPDGTAWKNIFKTRLENLIVEWPIKDKISLRTQVSGLAQGLLYTLNPSTGDFGKILSDIYGLSIKWSPRADKILYSSTSSRGKNPGLWVSDEKGANIKDLKLAGLADKCAWSKDGRTIFCALPQEISDYAVWPDDYYKGLLILRDDFYKINLETGEKTKIIGSTAPVSLDAQDIFLSPQEDYIFFINRSDGLLYSLKI